MQTPSLLIFPEELYWSNLHGLMANRWERVWYEVLDEKLGVCLLWVHIKKIVKSNEQQKWGEGEVECGVH